MAQGNASRVAVGVGTNNPGDSFAVTLGLDTRWEIVPGSMRFYASAAANPGWTASTYIGKDDGAGGFDPDGSGFTAVTATINYATGELTFDENTDNPLNTTSGTTLWVEYYERFPAAPADDFNAAFGVDNNGAYPLILSRVLHTALGSRVLSNHGDYCLQVYSPSVPNIAAVAEFMFKDPLFTTHKPVMSELAARWSATDAARMGPYLIQRSESDISLTRSGYRFGPCHYNNGYGGASNRWYWRLHDSSNFTFQRYALPGEILLPRYRTFNASNVFMGYQMGTGDNVAPTLYPMDWHKLRLISTIDAYPGDIHLHCMLAVGYAEVDKAIPTFETLCHAWHLTGTTTITKILGRTTIENSQANWSSTTPNGYPPIAGRQGFAFGGTNGTANQKIWIDDFRLYRMP